MFLLAWFIFSLWKSNAHWHSTSKWPFRTLLFFLFKKKLQHIQTFLSLIVSLRSLFYRSSVVQCAHYQDLLDKNSNAKCHTSLFSIDSTVPSTGCCLSFCINLYIPVSDRCSRRHLHVWGQLISWSHRAKVYTKKLVSEDKTKLILVQFLLMKKLLPFSCKNIEYVIIFLNSVMF